MNAHKTFNLVLVVVFAFSFLGMPARASAQESYPYIEVTPTRPSIVGRGWPLGSEITLSIDNLSNGPGTDYTERATMGPARWDPNTTEASFDLAYKVALEPGDLITITDDVVPMSYTVQELDLTNTDVQADTVSGTGTPGDELQICVNVPDYCAVRRYVIVGNSGDWIADFHSPGTQPDDRGTIDIQTGDEVRAIDQDEYGNSTNIFWPAWTADLFISACPVCHWISVHDPPWGTMVTLTIDDPSNGVGIDFTRSTTMELGTPEDPWGRFDLPDIELRPGFIVTVAAGPVSNTLTVSPLALTRIDLADDTVSGVATPGVELHVWVWTSSTTPPVFRYPVADALTGAWTADFSVPGTPPEDETTLDLVLGTNGGASEENTNRTNTWVNWSWDSAPLIEASFTGRWIQARNWPLGTPLTLTIDDPSNGVGIDYTGMATMEHNPDNPGDPSDEWADFAWPDIGLKPGYIVTVAGNGISKTLIISNLSANAFDSQGDTVAGMASPGGTIQVCANIPNNCISRHVTADGSGSWLADYHNPGPQPDEQGTVDIQVGTSGNVREWDEDGDQTFSDWWVPAPSNYLSAFLTENRVHGVHWTLGTSVTLTIDDPTNGTGVDYTDTKTVGIAPWDPQDTEVSFDLLNFILQPGQLVTLADGAVTKTLEVADLRVTNVDPDSGIVSGTTTKRDSPVVVDAWDEHASTYRVASADPISGQWSVDFSVPGTDPQKEVVFVLHPGVSGQAKQGDQDEDYTTYGWRVLNPYIHAGPNQGFVYARDWPSGAPVHMTVARSGSTVYISDATVGPCGDGNPGSGPCGPNDAYFDLGYSGTGVPRLDLLAGDVITLTGGGITRSMVVSALQVLDIKTSTDTLTGIADIARDVDVGVCAGPDLMVTPDSSGHWTANFTPFDILPGMCGGATQSDENGNITQQGWVVPNPFFNVALNAQNVHGSEWPLGAWATLTIHDPGSGQDYTATQKVGQAEWDPSQTSIQFDLGAFALRPGQFVTMTDGDITKTHTVADLMVTSVDPLEDTVSGTAGPGSTVIVAAKDDATGKYAERWVTADGFGDWTADFTEPVPDQESQGAFDLVPGSQGAAHQRDEDGDQTIYYWNIPLPSIAAVLNGDRLMGFDWPLSAIVHLEIDDPSTTDSPDFSTSTLPGGAPWDPSKTFFEIQIGDGYDLKPGDVLTVTDGETTKHLTATDVAITAGDAIADMISGTAQPGSLVEAIACDGSVCVYRRVPVHPGGNWMADFSTPGGSQDEQTILDLRPGMPVYAKQFDEDGDWTQFDWKLPPDPQIMFVSAPLAPVQLGQNVDVVVAFSVADAGSERSIALSWGDGTTTTTQPALSPVTISHGYTAAGVYTISATITDAAGETASATYQFVVVYDPNGGFVTGGGWIDSPAGAYAADPLLAGKATFGFVSKYQKGAKLPTGNTEFQFKVADLNFKSTVYDWLVVSGTRAQFKGTGTINGVGEYGFLLTAIDGSPDRFRIKIWDVATGALVYDNQPGAADSANPTTALGGGSIVIQRGK